MAKTGKNKLGIKPIGDKVLIQIPKREEKTPSGIIIPDSVSEEQKDNKRGKVIAVGEGKYENGALVPMSVKEGDEVLFPWGDKVEIDEEEYYIVNESNILAIIN